MKAEINSENKLKLFAQYWGQDIMYSDMYGPCGTIYSLTMKENGVENKSIELKSISEISDEDLNVIGFNFPYGKPSDFKISFDVDSYDIHWTCFGNGNIKDGNLKLSDFDYLRSRGYALPWMGLSVNEMVEAGWIKLK